MNYFEKITCVLLLIAVIHVSTQNVGSENTLNSNATDLINAIDDAQKNEANGRRSGLLILDNSGTSSNGHITAHKLETKTYTSRVTSGDTGSGLQGWVSGTQSQGNVILQPQVQGIVQNQQPCTLINNVPTNTGEQSSILHKHSTVESTQTFNGDGQIGSISSNDKQWQANQNTLTGGSLVVGQLGEQSLLQRPSQITTNNINDVTGAIKVNTGVQGLNTIENTNNFQKEESFYYPDHDSYKVSIVSSGDGIYANDLLEQQNQNLNLEVSSNSNSPHIVAVPVVRPQLGRVVVHGYRPNIQYYLKQIDTSNLLKNPSAVLRVPSFIENIKPDQMNINLSDEQLNSYKQYLIQSGLIKLKPYQLIFSDEFRPKLKTLQWMVVPLDSNAEYCRQRCGTFVPTNTLYSTLAGHANKVPLKLLVPVLKIRSDLTKTLGYSDIPGAYRKSSQPNAANENTNNN